MDLRPYGRLFPNQDVLPDGGFGNLMAASLQRGRRDQGLTVFPDLGTLEPYEDQWEFLSTLDRLTPTDAATLARRAKQASVGLEVSAVSISTATRVQPRLPAMVHADLGAQLVMEMRPALTAKSGSRGKIHDRCCQGLIASAASQRRTEEADIETTTPCCCAWAARLGQPDRDSQVGTAGVGVAAGCAEPGSPNTPVGDGCLASTFHATARLATILGQLINMPARIGSIGAHNPIRPGDSLAWVTRLAGPHCRPDLTHRPR